MKKERLDNLDVARTFANYCIVLLHAGAAFQYCMPQTFEYSFWTYLCWGLCPCALPALFLISGYLLFRNYSKKTYGKKMTSRIKRLVVPYIVWNLSFVVFYLVCGHFVPRLSARVVSFGLDSFSGAFDKILSAYVAPIDGPLWFLRTLVYLSILSPILWLFLKNKIGRYIGLLVIACCYAICCYTKVITSIVLVCPFYSVLIFYIGGMLVTTENYGGVFKWFKSKLWIVPSVIGIAILFYLVYLNRASYSVPEAMMDDLGKVLAAPLLFIIVNNVDIAKISANRTYRYFKDMSFFAYAGHFLFCSMIMHTAAPFFGSMGTGKFTMLVVIFCCVGVPVMAGIYWFGKRFLPHVMKLYDGTL